MGGPMQNAIQYAALTENLNASEIRCKSCVEIQFLYTLGVLVALKHKPQNVRFQTDKIKSLPC